MQPSDWLAGAIDELTDEVVAISPSQWAEEHRRLPAGTPLPGPYDYAVTPYLREIVDCFDVRSPVREVAVMKGAQIGVTVGVGENLIGYIIGQVRTRPAMLVTATQELVELRMEEYITPMIEQSELAKLIQSNTGNARKTGKTDKKLSWYGGGFLIPTGSREASKLRSMSIWALILDEKDSYPARVGRDGDPSALAVRRTSAYAKSRKILHISTPTTSDESRIAKDYADGDRRKFLVPCVGCDEYQELRWRVDDRDGEQIGGMIWETKDDRLVPGTAHYVCPHCGFCHVNEHKRKMLPLGRWEATATPKYPGYRSYHISGLLSPADFYSWDEAVADWMEAWDVRRKRAKDVEKLQEFYNNVLGEPFRTSGAKLTLAKVAKHARAYDFGTVPNHLAPALAGGSVGFLTCAVDVQKDFLAVAVFAWAPNRIGFLIDYCRFDGDTTNPNDLEGPWGKLTDILENKRYLDQSGRSYHVTITLIDSGYSSATVYAFCNQYKVGVYPVKGVDKAVKGAESEFSEMTDISKMGVTGWAVHVNHYKTRLNAVLKASPVDPLPVESVSFPDEIDDSALKELTAEEFVEETNKRTGRKTWIWKRRAARNELWDLTVYASAARDILAYQICRKEFEFDAVNWTEFWPWAEANQLGWTEGG